jgi:hypothetical protein
MTSADSASNFKNHNLIFEDINKREQKPKLIDSSLIYRKSNINQNAFNSGFSEKNNNNMGERFNSFNSIRGIPDYNFSNTFFFQPFKNYGTPLLSNLFSKNQNSNFKNEPKIPINYTTNFLLDNILKENNEFYKEKKEENNQSDNSNEE